MAGVDATLEKQLGGLSRSGKVPKQAKVKNKAPADLQITAEQLLREAKERELEIVPPPPKQKVSFQIDTSYKMLVTVVIVYYTYYLPDPRCGRVGGLSDAEEEGVRGPDSEEPVGDDALVQVRGLGGEPEAAGQVPVRVREGA